MKVLCKEVSSFDEFIDAIRIRVDVFIKEQGFEPGWEPDEEDKTAKQYIAYAGKEIVATARVRETKEGEFKIERMAIKKEYRGKGIGEGLVDHIINELKKTKPKRIWLQSQEKVKGFYEKVGFKTISEPIDRWGVFHIDMEYHSL